MVDNLALVASQLMMIFILWRCFTLPENDPGEGQEQSRPENTASQVKTDRKRPGRGTVSR